MEENKENKVNIINIIRKNVQWIVLLICLVIFFIIAEKVYSKEIMEADIIGYNFISETLISNSFSPIAKFITNFGGAVWLLLLIILSLIVFKNKKIKIALVLNLIIATALNFILKNIVQRPRPTEFRIIEETGYSFPSGHSMVSMAFYGYLIYLTYKYIKNKYLKFGIITLLSLLIISIGISRIYLGVHYTSDVIAGFLLSIAYLIIFTKVLEKLV